MEIIYQKELYNSPVIKPVGGHFIGEDSFHCKPLDINEIEVLERKYNNGNRFPTSLRELLFLAGKRCYVLDYGLNDTQEEIQEDVKEWLIDYGFVIARPFYVIDVYGGGDNFLFIYLDEISDDPKVQVANLDDNNDSSWLLTSNDTLSEFINYKIMELKKGYNPF